MPSRGFPLEMGLRLDGGFVACPGASYPFPHAALDSLGPLPRSACAEARQHTLDLVVPRGYKQCPGTEEKQCTYIITTRFLGIPLLLKEKNLPSGSL